MFVILFIVQLEPFVDKGPLWQQHLDRETCDDYWWTNLLYINNFYPTNVARDSVRHGLVCQSGGQTVANYSIGNVL